MPVVTEHAVLGELKPSLRLDLQTSILGVISYYFRTVVVNDPYIEANAPLFQAMALLQSSTAKLAAHDFDWLLLPYK